MGTKRILYWVCTSRSTMRLHGTSTCTCKWHCPDLAYFLLSTPTMYFILQGVYIVQRGMVTIFGQILVFFF